MVLFFHNPDRYDTATLPYFWDSARPFSGDTGTPGVRADGENSRPAFTSSGGNSLLEWHTGKPGAALNIHPVGNDFRVGGRFLFESWPAAPICILGVVAFQGDVQCCAVINPDGTLSIYRGLPGAGTELKDSAVALSLNTFYRLGFTGKVKSHGGEATIWNDRARIVSYPAQPDTNTEYQEGFFWDGFLYGLVEDCAVNHVYGGDSYGHLLGEGPAPEKYVVSQRPAANGSLVGWTPSGGTLYSVVADSVPDGMSTVAQAIESAQQFSVAQTASGASGDVFAIQDTVMVKNPGTQDPVGIQFLNADAGGVRTYGVIGIPNIDDFVVQRHIYYQRQDNGEAIDADYADNREVGLEADAG